MSKLLSQASFQLIGNAALDLIKALITYIVWNLCHLGGYCYSFYHALSCKWMMLSPSMVNDEMMSGFDCLVAELFSPLHFITALAMKVIYYAVIFNVKETPMFLIW